MRLEAVERAWSDLPAGALGAVVAMWFVSPSSAARPADLEFRRAEGFEAPVRIAQARLKTQKAARSSGEPQLSVF
jgi:hypothetical protein